MRLIDYVTAFIKKTLYSNKPFGLQPVCTPSIEAGGTRRGFRGAQAGIGLIRLDVPALFAVPIARHMLPVADGNTTPGGVASTLLPAFALPAWHVLRLGSPGIHMAVVS